MLVLSRKLNESIVINDNIRVTIVDIGHGKVRIGIDAPADVEIMREELLARRREFAEPDFAVVS